MAYGYIPPMYGSPYVSQYQNQFASPIPQQPFNLPPVQSNGIQGRVVEGIESVRTTEIPMTGDIHYFPSADGKSIYTKRWLQNGTTELLTYVPKIEEPPRDIQSVVESPDISKIISHIDERLDILEQKLEPPKATPVSRSVKGGEKQ